MIDTLINFETSKLAKFKGFHYNQLIIGLVTYTIEGVDKPLGGYTCFNEQGEFIIPKHYNAKNQHFPRPTQSLLQKWLRETHEIFVCVLPYNKPNKKEWEAIIEENSITFSGFNSYEEALEKALLEGLNLIK